MYWCVGAEQAEDCQESNMEPENGTVDMGNKQSTLGRVSTAQCPMTENIQAAYKEGEASKALELIKSSCEENVLKLEKCQLLSVAAEYGDLQAVRYLLQEALAEVPTEPSDDNPAVVAAYMGQEETVKELLNSLAGRVDYKRLLNWMLAVACQQGHLDVVKLLILEYSADPNCCAEKKNEFPNLKNLPFYAAIMAGNEDIAIFLLQNGAFFCSYILMDNPHLTKLLLRKYFTQPTELRRNVPPEAASCVRWTHLKLPWVEVDWFIDISCQIVELDLSANCLTSLPSIVPWGLIHLQRLNLHDNQLTELPNVKSSDEIICTRLLEIDVSSNRLSCLSPGFLHLTGLKKLIATKNLLQKLFDEENATNWIGLRKLQELDVSENQLTELPAIFIRCLKSLANLNVSKNNLKVFPDPWACPLKYFKASKNAIEFLPDTLTIFWKNHLKEVDFSDNSLKEVPQGLFQLENIVSLKLSGNLLIGLPSPDKWTCKYLKCLDLSKNQLGKNDEGTKTKRILFFSTKSRARAGMETGSGCSLDLPLFLSDSLEVLYLNDNQLDSVSPSVCQMKNLTELYLGNNPGIRELPAELGQLAGLWQLDIEDLNINNLPAEIRNDGPGAVLAYLRAQLRKAEKCKLMKMIIVGPPRQGKSALLEVLQTGKPAQPLYCDNTITTTSWELQRPVGSKAKIDSVMFNVWDIGGPDCMSTVNQCFFTDKALYVVVWNLALGEEAVAKLQFWLLSIEAKAPNAAVVVIGTHLDFIDTKFRLERIATLRAHVLALCRSPSGSRATGFPDITFKHLHELSCKSLEGLDGLRQLIFHMACNIKDVGSTISSQKLVGRLVPRSYLNLQEAILAEQQRRGQIDDVQFLTDLQIEQIIEQSPGNDIRDYEDLQAAISFLIETGTLLHFPDTSHGLRNLYFLDPVWLSECLERIINIKSSKSVAKNGVIKAEDLRMLLVGTGFTEQTEEQYFQFLTKFEIALPVANNRYLLPHLLPAKPGLDIHGLLQLTASSVQRLVKMSFVPVGFWQRFIARMLISLSEMDLQLFENKKTAKSRNRKVTVYSFTGNQRNRCSTFRVKRTQTIYWQEGLLVTFEGGYLSVESSDVYWKKKKSEGIKMICQSEIRDFSAMAFITDHVNSLIDQWFPALTATESDGTLLMQQFIPCHICSSPNTGQEATNGKTEGEHYFNVEDCVLNAIELDYMTCPNHPDIPVPLQELVPELFMTDFPARLFLEDKDLEYIESENNILGQGGSGTIIYRALYQGKPVAVKRFLIKKCRSSPDASIDTMFRHLQAMEAMRNFSEFRQEASMLHSLTHPCIVALIGICIHPLCFALELAPLGSLNSVILERSKGTSFMPLGHMLTHRVAYQIAAGLAYLHKKNIIFCDLKSDNILVWSLDVKEFVNVKLSDYGISRQSFHEGALGVEGTPGYQAPEIKPRIVYDEKVDMFSYGMVLYELLSGQRPSLGHHQFQIAKKLSKGIRPILGQQEEVQFHRLQSLMMECWDTKPEKRPLAASVVWQMKNPSFAVFMYLLQCGNQDSFFSSQGQEHTVVFWDGKEHERNYTIVNTEKGLVEVQRMSCPGMKICHQLKVQNALWTATEDQKMYVYGLHGMCPLKTPEKVLDTPAIVTSFLTVSVVKKDNLLVFAGLSDGLVAVFPVAQGIPDGNCSYICSHTANRSKFKIADDDPRQNPYPVKAMEFSKYRSEVWYSNGPGILIIDCMMMEITKRVEPYSPPSLITSIVCSLGCDGDEVVWCLDDKTNCLVMFHATTYQLCARYCCGDISPLRDMFTIEISPEVIPDSLSSTSIHRKVLEDNPTADMTIIFSEEGGTQLISHQDSLTDYVSISSYSSSPPNVITRSSSSLLSSPVSSSSMPFSTDCEDPALELNLPPAMLESSATPTESAPHLQATKILAVKDLLWVPRQGGDIIVIGLEKEAGIQRGRVIAVLKAEELEPYGMLVEAALVAKDTVVCCFKKENMDWCLAVWRGWSAGEFDVFYQGYEELGRLETCMRKRR